MFRVQVVWASMSLSELFAKVSAAFEFGNNADTEDSLNSAVQKQKEQSKSNLI